MLHIAEIDSLEVIVIADNEVDPMSPCTHPSVQASGGIRDIGMKSKIDHFSSTTTFSPSKSPKSPTFSEVKSSPASWWHMYWETGVVISLPATSNSSAAELQRRIILSQYVLAVNSAGKDPPQESGLVNNGWYGKFHMEMYFWHSVH